MRIAAIQMRSGASISENLDVSTALIKDAKLAGADFIATPEMTHLMLRSPKRLFQAIAPEDEDLGVAHYSALAKDLNTPLLIGSLAIKVSETKALNRSYLFGADGDILARYDKIHLFDVTISRAETYKESNVYQAGDRAVTAKIGEAKLGLSICYDVRFGELYRHYAQIGSHILMIPAAFTKPTGEAHWETLLRARAIETGSFVVAPAQGGLHEDGRTTWGRSMIIGPWGDIRAALDNDEPGFVSAIIDLNDVDLARRKIPAWQYNPPYSLTDKSIL